MSAGARAGRRRHTRGSSRRALSEGKKEEGKEEAGRHSQCSAVRALRGVRVAVERVGLEARVLGGGGRRHLLPVEAEAGEGAEHGDAANDAADNGASIARGGGGRGVNRRRRQARRQQHLQAKKREGLVESFGKVECAVFLTSLYNNSQRR